MITKKLNHEQILGIFILNKYIFIVFFIGERKKRTIKQYRWVEYN
jgi:hypothetical protein